MYVASRVISRVFNQNSGSAPCLVSQLKVISLSNGRKPIFNYNLHTNAGLYGKVQFNLSDIGEGIREVVVKEWFVKVGDKVSQFDNICEVQSDKASVTITSRYDGTITKLHYHVDSTALVGKPLVEIDADGVEDDIRLTEHEIEPIKKEVGENHVEDSNTLDLCIPSVRRLAKQYKINLRDVRGSGKKGRILKEDILKFLDHNGQTTFDTELKVKDSKNRIEPMNGFQKAMFKSMTDSLKIPHFVYSDEVSVKKLSEVRRSMKAEMEKNNIKISFMPFFIKAASNALTRFPILNSSLVGDGEQIEYKSSHNIGVAMDTKSGLAVPVIKNVDQLNILEIAIELNRLMKSGKAGTFSTNDIIGGTFTISNIGVVGGTYTKPVIMPPQVSIIAIGAIKVLPRFNDSQNVIADEIASISGAADHRIVDGATMAHFTNFFKKQLENPYLLFLNL